MRRAVFGTVALMATLLSAPVAADNPNSALHLEHGVQDAAGCYALELWNGDSLIKTFPANDGSPPVHCAHNKWAVSLPNGQFVFDWVVFRQGNIDNQPDQQIYATNGALRGCSANSGTTDAALRSHPGSSVTRRTCRSDTAGSILSSPLPVARRRPRSG